MPSTASRSSKRKRPSNQSALNETLASEEVNCASSSPTKRRVTSDNFNYQHVVTIHVGDQATPFLVHAHILRKVSPFFEAALSSRWNASEQIPVELPEDDSQIFNAFVGWSYSGRIEGKLSSAIPPAARQDGVTDLPEAKADPDVMHSWVELYRFADKIQAIKLKNDIIDLFLAAGNRMLDMSSSTMALIWNEPPSEKDKLRSLLYHMMIWKAKPEHIHEGMYTDAPRLVGSVLRYFLQRNPNKGPLDIKALNWHEPVEKK
ncbi:hypothetical protein KVT40_001071 [Elsinoe batatas]|uniref:BTB domain-containing protein n=1 Tax=Elsinoe batatas TaxID=2601811 RepID=A0A8K0L8I2_9PEZI|nr:hypothetical protein KVT40_001071 [Elsinoe batatas]